MIWQNNMWYILTFIIGFFLSGVCFGTNLILQNFFIKRKLYKLQGFGFVFASIIPTVIICICFSFNPFHFSNMLDLKLWLIAFMTVVVVSLISSRANNSYEVENTLLESIEAGLMEIPQRAMMQTFICGLLTAYNLQSSYGIILTALIWCASIIVQACVTRNSNCLHLVIDLLASFVFSIGIGYVFYCSECILIPMLAHGMERFGKRMIVRKENRSQ